MFWSAETATSGAPANATSLICATVQSSEDEIMSEVGQYLAAHLARTERTTVLRCERHCYLLSCVPVVVLEFVVRHNLLDHEEELKKHIAALIDLLGHGPMTATLSQLVGYVICQ